MKNTCTCRLCGYSWHARSTSPVMCPKCHSYRWHGDTPPAVEFDTLTCLRCGYTWKRRTERSPKVCPACSSPLWNTPRKLNRKKAPATPRTAPRPAKYPYKRPSP